MAVALADILDQRQVALQMTSRRRPNAIRELASLFEKTGSIARAADFLAQVLAREEAGATLAENGVAFPHARTDLVDELHSRSAAAKLAFPGTIRENARTSSFSWPFRNDGERLSRPGRNFGPRHARPRTAQNFVCRRNSSG